MESVYMIILNIPPSFHSCDLRNYFSDFVERQTHFTCFHFRHRPQLELVQSLHLVQTSNLKEKIPNFSNSHPGKSCNFVTKDSRCCIVKCFSESARTEAIKKYNFQNWVDKDDRTLSTNCIAVPVTVNEGPVELPISSLCVNGQNVEINLAKEKIEEMFELKPPLLMPGGNIGTSTKHFLVLINSCRLPSNLIGKLGLNFPKTKNRKYGSVPFNYGSHFKEETGTSEIEFTNSSKQKAPRCRPVPSTLKGDTKKEEIQLNHEEEEEWDRHEALHDDVTEQERNKERLYEEEMEVVWEKGGPGIVWYTDAQRWQEAEGDFDEQTADDWDVDYSVYFEENGGDKDARDCVEMRQSEMWRNGSIDSVFTKPQEPFPTGHKPRKRPIGKRNIVGSFEQHTRGIGRRLMEKHGWRDGSGLGRSQKGIAQPIESDGQKPRERKGLGYFGEQLPRFGTSRSTRKPKETMIATIYDKPTETDPPEPLLRRNQPTTMKYRYM